MTVDYTLAGEVDLSLDPFELVGFAFQAVLRSVVFRTPIVAPLPPMTGFVFVIYTNYMITDPGTTRVEPLPQAAFGFATVYGILVSLHVVFGPFFALTLVSLGRGAGLYAASFRARVQVVEPRPMPIGSAR